MNAPRVAIIDYGTGNLFSVRRACEHASLNGVITSSPKVLDECEGIILPGVGAYGDAMSALNATGLSVAILRAIEHGKPFLGVCLGIQLLMTESLEFGRHRGLGVIPGVVVPFQVQLDLDVPVKVPQMQWNRVARTTPGDWRGTLLDGTQDKEFFYFVHSYYVIPDDPAMTVAETEYGGVRFCAALRKGNVFACQFHPERSAAPGLRIYERFALQITGFSKGHDS